VRRCIRRGQWSLCGNNSDTRDEEQPAERTSHGGRTLHDRGIPEKWTVIEPAARISAVEVHHMRSSILLLALTCWSGAALAQTTDGGYAGAGAGNATTSQPEFRAGRRQCDARESVVRCVELL